MFHAYNINWIVKLVMLILTYEYNGKKVHALKKVFYMQKIMLF